MEKDSHKATLYHVTHRDGEFCDLISRRTFLSQLRIRSMLLPHYRILGF